MSGMVVSVAELKQAARLLQAGAFRPHPPANLPDGLRPVVVAGVAGSTGASTVALALAELLPGAVLWDCAPATASGLVGVCTRELGREPSGWWQGYRHQLLVHRNPLAGGTPADLPTPPACEDGQRVVVDAGVDALTLTHATGWLAGLLTHPAVPLVLTARCTAPMMRRLAVVLDRLEHPDRDVRMVVLGPPRRRWPRPVVPPPALARLEAAGRLVCLPPSDALAVTGPGVDPLPAPVLAALENLTTEGTLS